MTKTLIYLVLLGCTSAAFTPAVAQQSSAAPAWRQSQETNAAAAYTYTRFTLVGRYTDGHNQSADRPALVVDCTPRSGSYYSDSELTARLRAGSALKIIYVEPSEAHGIAYFPEVAVQYAANDGKNVKNDTWMSGSDKSSASVPRSALKSFLKAREVSILAQDDRGSLLAMRFDMPDPTPVAEACGLDVH